MRDNPGHVAQAKENEIEPIDMVVVNLYPFEQTVAKPDVTLDEAIENIDIGGPSMLRSAAKNYRSVTVVVDPADYADVLENMRDNEGATTLKLRERLAIKVFITTSKYDGAIGNYLNREQETTCSFSISLPIAARLRYGENPHQQASLYGNFDDYFQKLHGKELSFNNILDITRRLRIDRRIYRADRGDPQAHQSLRRRFRSRSEEGVGQGLRHRQTGALRRHHHLQPPAHRAARKGDQRDFQRSDHRAGVRARCARAPAEEKEPPPHAQACRD